MSKEYILKLFNDLGITMEDFKAEAKRLEQIEQANNRHFGFEYELSAAKDMLKIFEQGYFEVQEVRYYKKPYIVYGDTVRFYLGPDMSITKVEVISTNDSTMMMEVTDTYVSVQKTTDPHVITEIMDRSPQAQWIYNHISQTSHEEVKKYLQDLQEYLAQCPEQSTDPVDDRFKALDNHRTDKELHDMYYEYDPYEGYFGGLGLTYSHFIEILEEELK